MAGEKPGQHCSGEIDWELEQIAQAAKRVELAEQAELRAELARRLLVLKTHRRARIRHWRAYIRRFLKNQTRNWLRARHTRKKRAVILDAWDEDKGFEESLPADILQRLSQEEGDFGLAFKQLWEELGPELQRIWLVLMRKGGNQAAAAKGLRIHRNTVILRIKKIRGLLEKHGFRGR